MIPFKTEETMSGIIKDPSPTLIIPDMLSNLELEEGCVESSFEEREEEGSSIESADDVYEDEN